MARQTAAEKREEKERQRQRDEERARQTYIRGLSQIDNTHDAYNFANNGPSNGEPGGNFYHNLGCHLHSNPLNRPNRWELDELEKFEQRVAAKRATKPA